MLPTTRSAPLPLPPQRSKRLLEEAQQESNKSQKTGDTPPAPLTTAAPIEPDTAAPLVLQPPTTPDEPPELTAIFERAPNANSQQMGEMVKQFVLSKNGRAMTDAQVEAMFRQIVRAAFSCNGLQLAGMIRAAGEALGGRDMSASHRNAMLSQLAAPFLACDTQQRQSVLGAFSAVLGEREMSPESRDALLAKFATFQGQLNPNQLRVLFSQLALSLGGVTLSAANRDALLAHIINAGATCSAEQLCTMTYALIVPLGAEQITAENLNALLSTILTSDHLCTPSQIRQMIAGVVAALNNAKISVTNRSIVISQCVAAQSRFSGENLRALFWALTWKMGGQTMSPENYKAMIMHVLNVHKMIDENKMGNIIGGIVGALGERMVDERMAESTRDTLLNLIFAAHGTVTYGQFSHIVLRFCCALGGQRMARTNRDAIWAKIATAHATLSSPKFAEAVRAFCFSLGIGTVHCNRATLIAQVLALRSHCDYEKMRASFGGVCMALGGTQMTDQLRTELCQQVLSVPPDRIGDKNLKPIFAGITGAYLLSGQDSTEQLREAHSLALCREILNASRIQPAVRMAQAIAGVTYHTLHHPTPPSTITALVAQIFAAAPTCSTEQMWEMIVIIADESGSRGMTTAFRDFLFEQILSARSCSDGQIVAMIEAHLLATMLGSEMPASLNQFLEKVLAAPTSCDATRMKRIFAKISTTLCGRSMSASHLALLMTKTLESHAQNSPARMAAMVFELAKISSPIELLKNIFRSGASPIKKAVMIAAVVSSQKIGPEKMVLLRPSVIALLAAIEKEQPGATTGLSSFIDAGILAGQNNLTAVLQLRGMNAGEKLNIIECARANLAPGTHENVPLSLSNLINVSLPDTSLHIRAIALFLKTTPATGGQLDGAFETARLTHLGKLVGIVDRENTGAAALGTWYMDFHELYYSYREHMTLEFIQRELRKPLDEKIIPEDIQKKIRAVLTERAEALNAKAKPQGGVVSL